MNEPVIFWLMVGALGLSWLFLGLLAIRYFSLKDDRENHQFFTTILAEQGKVYLFQPNDDPADDELWQPVFKTPSLNQILPPADQPVLMQEIRNHANNQAAGFWFTGSNNRKLFCFLSKQDNNFYLFLIDNPTLSDFYQTFLQREYILNDLPFPVWGRKKNLQLFYCNQAYANILGKDQISIILDHSELLAPGQGINLQKLAGRSLDLNLTQSESHHVIIGGKRHLLDFQETPVSEEGLKKDFATIGIALDVTGLEDLQNRLSQQISAHAEILETIDTGIAIYSPESRLRFFNQAYCKILGLSENFLGKNPSMADVLEQLRNHRRIPEQVDFVQYKKDLVRLYMSVTESFQELWHLSDGSTLRLGVSPHPFGGVLMRVDDVTDRLSLERSYNTLIDVQRATIDHLHEAVAVFGGDGRLKLANAAYRKYWQPENVSLNQAPHISEIVPKIEAVLLPQPGKTSAMQATEVIGLITNGQSRQGKVELKDGRVFQFSVEPLPDGSSLFSYLDISDSFRAAEALQQRNEALEAADKMKTTFLANISYEFRTPLNAIVGFTEMLQAGYWGQLPKAQQPIMGNIIEASAQLTQLIDDVLDVTAIEAGYLELARHPVNLRELLQQMLDSLLPQAKQQQISIHFYPAINQAWIYGDEKRLKQALMTIISNAISRSSVAKSVNITLKFEQGLFILTVKDQGKFLSPLEQKATFEKFANNHARKKSGANYLSMALSKQLIVMHQGSILLESTATETTITCAFPAQMPEK